MQKYLIGLFLVAVAGLLAGCISIYRADVQQGNVITEEMAGQLKLGMNRRQVQFLLGTPLVADPFHPERWDYFYSLTRDGDDEVQRRLMLLFKDDVLVDIRGDVRTGGSGAPVSEPAEKGSSAAQENNGFRA